jgi:integrase
VSTAVRRRVREGGVSVIQKQLGHTSLAVTKAYLDPIAPGVVVEIMKQRLCSME